MPADDGASRTTKRLILTAGVLLVVIITGFALLQLWPSGETTEPAAADESEQEVTPTEVTDRFLGLVTSGRADQAAGLTDDPVAAAAQLAAVWRTLAPSAARSSRTALVEPAAPVPFTWTWTLAGGRVWEYESTLRLVRDDAGWRVQWQPTVVHPRLAAGQSLVLRDHLGQPAVLDRDGTPLLTWSESGTAAVDPAVAPVLLPSLGRVAKGQGDAAGWYVAVVDAAGAEVGIIHGAPPAPLTSTVSVPVQKAAQAAVDQERRPAMLVAIQPSTGDILAVAQNTETGSDPVALNGLYPPGSTFKIATATAIIESGGADTDTVLPCPASATIGQRTIPNSDDFALGEVPLRKAFAMSCNTTFAMQAAKLPPDALPDAANQLGLGADFVIPGITTEAGKVPAAASTTEQVENSIGQGRVQASCFGVTLMSATVAAGQAVTPRLWRDVPTEVTTGYEAPPAPVIGSLRTMMRETVTSGRATDLSRHGKVHGKTGTAETATDTDHGWFTGYRNDVAFTVLVEGGGSSAAAVAVTSTFLG